MFTLSAFADEVSPEPELQLQSLLDCGIRFVELRSVHHINVLKLSDQQVESLNDRYKSHRIGVSAIASPIGKSGIDESFADVLAQLDRAIEVARLFRTNNIRVFSFYPGDETWAKRRGEVIYRLQQLVGRATNAKMRLLHENEHRIYGESPAHVADLLQSVPGLAAVHDPANYVVCGHDPWAGWLACRDRAVHLHMKDWVHGEPHGRVVGDGDGRLHNVLADAVNRGFDGFATLEPHLLGGGPTGGQTGVELFPKAVAALRKMIQFVGGMERTT